MIVGWHSIENHLLVSHLGFLHKYNYDRAPANVEFKPFVDPVTFETFECPICMDDVEPGAGYCFEKCQHKFCGVCLDQYYTQCISNGKADGMKCPGKDCTTEIVDDDLIYILSPELHAKYILFKKIAEVNKDPEMRWCPNPNGCEQASRRQDKNNRLMICELCEFEFCFDCSKPFHPGKSCQDAKKLNLFGSDFRVNMWKKFYTKACPNCDAAIFRTEGCNHMTCAACKHEFCWLCLKTYSTRHYEIDNCSMYGGAFTKGVKTVVRKLVSLPKKFVNGIETEYRDTSSDDDELSLLDKVKMRLWRVGESPDSDSDDEKPSLLEKVKGRFFGR